MTDEFSVEEEHIFGVAAEKAGGLIFTENDFVAFREDFEGIAAFNIERIADFYRNDDTAEFINFSDHAGRFHNSTPLEQVHNA